MRFRIHFTQTGHIIMVLNTNHGPWQNGVFKYPWILWGKMDNNVWTRYYYNYEGKQAKTKSKTL